MPLYITYLKMTQKGAETIKESPQRCAQAAKWIQAVGGRVIGAYATTGRFDYVYIVELPDVRSGMEVVVKTAMQGAVSTETVEALPLEEFLQIVARV